MWRNLRDHRSRGGGEHRQRESDCAERYRASGCDFTGRSAAIWNSSDCSSDLRSKYNDHLASELFGDSYDGGRDERGQCDAQVFYRCNPNALFWINPSHYHYYRE